MPYADPERQKEYHRQYRQANKHRWANYEARKALWSPERKAKEAKRDRAWYLKKKHGMSENAFEKMLASQKGRCAICGTDKPGGKGKKLHIDHCHTTDNLRGLLCMACNMALGWYEKHARAVALYLVKHR